jgi:hypothetical protein
MSACCFVLVAGLAAVQGPADAPPPELVYPVGVLEGRDGSIFIADSQAPGVFRLKDGKLSVVYRGTKFYRTPLYRAWAMAQFSNGDLLVSDPATMDAWRLKLDGTLTPFTGERVDLPAGTKSAPFAPTGKFAGKFDKPMSCAIDANDTAIVADLGLGAVFRMAKPGDEPQEIAKVAAPRGLAKDREGAFVVVSHGQDQLLRVTAQGEVKPIVKGPIAKSGLSFPHQVVVLKAGYAVSDGYAKAIWRISEDGKVETIHQAEPLRNPVGIALDHDANILIADPHAKSIFKLTQSGSISLLFGKPPQ